MRWILISGLVLGWTAAADAAEVLSGPIAAKVIRAVDGDTLEIEVSIWLGLNQKTSVRLRGLDTPEIKGKCQIEKDLALAAKTRLAKLAGAKVWLRNVTHDKYAGRVLAEVVNLAGDDIGLLMIADGLARPYDGGKRKSWCP